MKGYQRALWHATIFTPKWLGMCSIAELRGWTGGMSGLAECWDQGVADEMSNLCESLLTGLTRQCISIYIPGRRVLISCL